MDRPKTIYPDLLMQEHNKKPNKTLAKTLTCMFKVPKAANHKGVCLQNKSKFYSYHLKIWQLL